MSFSPLVIVPTLLLAHPCAAKGPVHLIVERESSHWFSHTHMAPGGHRVVISDKETRFQLVEADDGESQGDGSEDNAIIVLGTSVPRAPMKLHWIGDTDELPGAAMAVEVLKDGRFLVATRAEFAEPEATGVYGVVVARFEALDITVISPEGEVLGSLTDLGYWPDFFRDDRYFDRRRSQIRSVGDAEEPVELMGWIEGVHPIDGLKDIAIYETSVFSGLMTSAGQPLTGATWFGLDDLGDGRIIGYRVDRSVELLDAQGRSIATLPPGYVHALGDDTFVCRDRSSTSRVRIDGGVIWTLPYPARFGAIRSSPGRFLVGILNEEWKVDCYRIWDLETDRFVRDLPFDDVSDADDTSPYLSFQVGDDAGLLTDSGDEVFRLVASGPAPYSMKEGDERKEWRSYGRVFRNASMFQLIVRSMTAEDDILVHDEVRHEYLIDASGEVLWQTDGAPTPEIVLSTRPKP